MKRILILLSLVIGFGGGINYLYHSLPVRHEPGVRIAPKTPVQQPMTEPIPPFDFKGFTIQPVAEFFVTARVLSRRSYSDDVSDIAPVDLALGWGTMSDQAILDQLTIAQSARFYFYQHALPGPASPEALKTSSSNMHLIPSTDAIRRAIGRVRKGEVVHFTGYLVNVSRDDGLSWRSSLTRGDAGKGACEIVFVSSFEVVPPSKD